MDDAELRCRRAHGRRLAGGARRQPAAGPGRYPRATILPHSTSLGRRAPRVPSPTHAPAAPRRSLTQSRHCARSVSAFLRQLSLCINRDRATLSEVKCRWMRFPTEYSAFAFCSVGFVYSWWVSWTSTAPRGRPQWKRALSRCDHFHFIRIAGIPRPRRPTVRGRWPCARPSSTPHYHSINPWSHLSLSHHGSLTECYRYTSKAIAAYCLPEYVLGRRGSVSTRRRSIMTQTRCKFNF